MLDYILPNQISQLMIENFDKNKLTKPHAFGLLIKMTCPTCLFPHVFIFIFSFSPLSSRCVAGGRCDWGWNRGVGRSFFWSHWSNYGMFVQVSTSSCYSYPNLSQVYVLTVTTGPRVAGIWWWDRRGPTTVECVVSHFKKNAWAHRLSVIHGFLNRTFKQYVEYLISYANCWVAT